MSPLPSPQPVSAPTNPFMVAALFALPEGEKRRQRHLRCLAHALATLPTAETAPHARRSAARAFCLCILLAHDRADESLADALAGVHLTACSLRTSRLALDLVLRLHVGLILDAAGIADPAGTLARLWQHLGPALSEFGDLEVLGVLSACQRLALVVENERADRIIAAALRLCRRLMPDAD